MDEVTVLDALSMLRRLRRTVLIDKVQKALKMEQNRTEMRDWMN